ncbi:unnamed protein product [marine sediment metagenome]|uniref:Uncharacterized protein n=1 Tax=marine sediment metagenome TaxID=412755 RepID=X0RUY4_9ZZZZ
MIKKNVKSIFVGKVGIPQKYVENAIERKEDLCLVHQAETMIIPWEQLEKKGTVGDEVFLDKFNDGKYYRLIYFKWKPSIIQKKLI